MRLFIALDLSERQKEEIQLLQQRLHSYLKGVKWVRPPGLHLTLKFLGEVEPGRVTGIVESMETAAAQTGAFKICFGGSGVFPTPHRARILWLGMREGFGPVTAVAGSLESNLAEKGFPAEKRRFTPHLTLGRLREPLPVEMIQQFLDEERSFFTAPAPAEGITLYRSDLSRHGAVYTAVQKILFGR